jgi:hypothetical protein
MRTLAESSEASECRSLCRYMCEKVKNREGCMDIDRC